MLGAIPLLHPQYADDLFPLSPKCTTSNYDQHRDQDIATNVKHQKILFTSWNVKWNKCSCMTKSSFSGTATNICNVTNLLELAANCVLDKVDVMLNEVQVGSRHLQFRSATAALHQLLQCSNPVMVVFVHQVLDGLHRWGFICWSAPTAPVWLLSIACYLFHQLRICEILCSSSKNNRTTEILRPLQQLQINRFLKIALGRPTTFWQSRCWVIYWPKRVSKLLTTQFSNARKFAVSCAN